MKDSAVTKRGTLVIAAVIIAVIGLFALIMVFSGEENSTEDVTYNGFIFRETNGVWSTEWQNGDQVYKLYFRHHPGEVEHIPIQGSIDQRFQNATIHLAFDPSEENTIENSYLALAGVELSGKLVEPLKRNVISACTKNSSVCAGRPVVTCDSDHAVIHLKQGGYDGVILDGNCITVQGNGEGIVMAADKILFRFLRIMN